MPHTFTPTQQYELSLTLHEHLVECQSKCIQYRKQIDNPTTDEFSLSVATKLRIEEKEAENIETTIKTLQRLKLAK